VLPGTRGPLEHHVRAEHPQQAFDRRERVRIAAHHDGEPRFPGPDVSAGDGSVECVDTPLRGRGSDACGQRRRGRRHVEDVGARRSRLQDAARCEVDLLDVGRVPDHRDDGRRTAGRLTRRLTPCGAEREERLRLRAGTVVDAQAIPLTEQVARHRGSHDTRSDETDDRSRIKHGASLQPPDADET